jgi:HEAT repeat protein
LHPLLDLAERDPDYTVRQEACWALGSLRDDRAEPVLLHIAQTPYDAKIGAQTEYRDFFLKIAAGCALARLDSNAGRAALRALLQSPAEADRSAAATGLGAFGTARDLPTLVTLVDARPENNGFIADFVIGYAGRFGAKAIPLYAAALQRDSVAKFAVFGLAALGKEALPALLKLRDDPTTSPIARRRAALALKWIAEP